MDLNHLLHRYQISLMRADAARSVEARHAHRGLARQYAARIAETRQNADAPLVLAVAE
jgi:hypothetical protein